MSKNKTWTVDNGPTVTISVTDTVTGRQWVEMGSAAKMYQVAANLMSKDNSNRLVITIENPWSSAT